MKNLEVQEVKTPSKKPIISLVICAVIFVPLFFFLYSRWILWPARFFWWVFVFISVFTAFMTYINQNEYAAIYFIPHGLVSAIIAVSFYHHFDWYAVGIFFLVLIFFIVLGATLSVETKMVIKGDTKKPIHFGSAAWAETIGEHANGDSRQFILGRTVEDGEDKVFHQMGHMLTCAPSGAGKGIGVVIPNLLEYTGSVFCVDIKGENYAVTAERRRALGQKIILLDPFGVTSSEDWLEDNRDTFNLIDWLRAFPEDLTADSQMIADALIVNSGSSDFWNDSARDAIRGIIAYVSTLDPERANMGELRRIITLTKDDLFEVLEDMRKSVYPVIERCANTIISMDEKTRSGVFATAQQQTAFLDEPRIANTLSHSSFDLSRFKLDPMSFYLVMPPERLVANFRLIRLFISLLITSVTRIKGRAPAPALFLFDEFAQLGRMTILEDTLSLIRGYGASYWFIIQDLSQLKAVYEKWQTFLANTTKQFFSTSDYDTAKYISDTIGKETTETGEALAPSEKAKNGELSFSEVTAEMMRLQSDPNYVARDLITPDEVMRLRSDEVLIFTRSERPYKITRLNYLEDADFQGKYNPNPMH